MHRVRNWGAVLALMLATAGFAGAVEGEPGAILTCERFIHATIDADPEFDQALQTYLKAAYGRLTPEAMGAWTLGAGTGWVRSESLGTNLFEPKTVDARTFELSVQKLFLGTGTRLKLAHANGLSDLTYAELELGGFGGPDLGQFMNTSTRSSTPEVTLSLVQPLLKNAFGLADRFPLRAADLQARAAELDVQEAWENRLERLFGAYLSWAAAQENVLAYRQITKDLQRVEEQVGRKVQAGVAERSDLLRTRENILRYQGLLVSAEGSYRNETARVASLRTSRALPSDQVPPARPQLELALGECNVLVPGSGEAGVRDLRLPSKLRLLREQLELQSEVAGNRQLPSLDLVGSVTAKGWTPDHSGGYDHLDRKDGSVLLTAQYPLGAAQARGEGGQARAGLAELDRSLAVTERDLTLGLQQLAQSLRDQEAILLLNQDQEASAEERLRLDERNYRIGRLDTFYLIDSTNALTTARLQRVQSQIQLQRLKLSYLSLSDQLLGRFPDLTARLRATEVR